LSAPPAHGIIDFGGGRKESSGMIARLVAPLLLLAAVSLVSVSPAALSPASAAQCGGDFNAFLAEISREAQQKGVPRSVVARALAGVSQDRAVLAFDRRQRGTFRMSFEQYSGSRVTAARVSRGKQMFKRHAGLLSRIEKQFGVPRAVIVAIWGLESDFGAAPLGKLSVVRTLATMAHDCRRTELFQGELHAALQILARGDYTLETLRGAYAGELGQTQFLPSSYLKYGVDYDRDGRVDLNRSVPDVLASTANLLATNGWRRGAPFGEGTENFMVLRDWNRSELYRKTIALFAGRLEGR
jgi:lytic murein transglycosylase